MNPTRTASPICLLTLALALTSVALSAADPAALLWPLPIHQGCTSSFGESRGQRFHGGADFRTNYEEGWPVLAVTDGTVVRIRRESYGYGRVLYLQMDDGRMAVYGHLCRFENDSLGLEDKLLAACVQKGTSFPEDIFPDPPVRVHAGDTLAFSGEMGVGFPHLHLEIRRGSDMLCPFAEGLPLPKGVGSPRLVGVTFTPRSPEALVDGKPEPLFVPARQNGSGEYVLNRPVTLYGSVDAALVGNDTLGIPDKKTGLTHVVASLDGDPFYTLDLKRFSLETRWQAGWILDPDRGHGGNAGLVLRRAPAVTIPGIEGPGLSALKGEDPHALEIVATNRAGKSSRLKGTVKPGEGIKPRLALPGRGYRFQSSDILPTGLLLELRRKYSDGVTPLLIGGKPPGDLVVVTASEGGVTVLIPKENLPREGAEIFIEDKGLDLFVASGPGGISVGKLRLNLPEGAIGLASPLDAYPSGAVPDSGARLRVGPFPLRTRANITFSGLKSKAGLGVYSGNGERFRGMLGGTPTPFRNPGGYCLRKDTTHPKWSEPWFHTIPNIKSPELRIKLTDTISGVNVETLRIELDGKPAYFDWDADKAAVRIAAEGIPSGSHILTGSVSDSAGNSVTLPKRTFVKK